LFNGRLSLIHALLVACSIHALGITVVSIATVKGIQPENKYLEVSLISPSDIKYARSTSPFPIEKSNYNPESSLPPNFFYRRRSASLEVALTYPRGKTEGKGILTQPQVYPGVILQSEQAREYIAKPRGIESHEREIMVRELHIASPERQYWIQKIAVEKEVKLKVHLDSDGRVRWVDLNTSSGNSFLDALIKDMVGRWQFGSLYQDD